MHTDQIHEFLSLPAPRQIPAALRRRIRDTILPPVVRYAFAGATLLTLIVSVFILYLMLIQFRLWHDLVLDFSTPALAQGKIISTRYIPPARTSSEETLAGFLFTAGNKREYSGVCSWHQEGLSKGEQVQIEYLNTNPSISRIKGGTIRPRSVTYSVLILPLFILPLSLLPFLIMYRERRTVFGLFACGTPVTGIVDKIERVARGYSRATITFTQNGATRTVHEYIRGRTAAALENKKKNAAPVILVVAPAQPKKYFLTEKIA
jgi:hypothetical protein